MLEKQNEKRWAYTRPEKNHNFPKDKIKLTDNDLIENKLLEIKGKFKSNQITTIDGLKIDFKDSWIHLRKSNTEPILRIYAESNSKIKSIELIDKFKNYFVNQLKSEYLYLL